MVDLLTHQLDRFAEWAAETFRTDGRFDAVRRAQAETSPGQRLSLQLEAGPKSHYEICVEPGRLEVQVGFATEDPTLNEAIEQGIQDSGDTLTELVEAELLDMGQEPVEMEHFYERPRFRYVTRVELDTLDELNTREFKSRVQAILDACHLVFQEWVDEV